MLFEWAAEGAKIGVETLFAIVTLLAGAGAVLAVVAILVKLLSVSARCPGKGSRACSTSARVPDISRAC